MGLRARPPGLDEVLTGLRLLWRLGPHLRRPLEVAESRAILEARFAHREADFLGILRHAIYGQAQSPYRQLLRWAGCEYGDIEHLVGLDGVEGALRTLYRHGVYLTADEFKGRRPAIRGTATIEVGPARLLNPRTGVHLLGRSSGSRGSRTPVPMDLAFIRDRAVNACLTLHWRSTGGRPASWSSTARCRARLAQGRSCIFTGSPEPWLHHAAYPAPGSGVPRRSPGHDRDATSAERCRRGRAEGIRRGPRPARRPGFPARAIGPRVRSPRSARCARRVSGRFAHQSMPSS